MRDAVRTALIILLLAVTSVAAQEESSSDEPMSLAEIDRQLNNLVADPGETRDLAADHPDHVAELGTGWTAYAEANGVIHPETPVAYGKPVSGGKY